MRKQPQDAEIVPNELSSEFKKMESMLNASSPRVRAVSLLLALGFVTAVPAYLLSSLPPESPEHANYLGFDRNEYPGDANLVGLRESFSFSGYWLNNPPGASNNTWTGKRDALRTAGFGFVVVFNGRLYAEIKAQGDAAKLGASDAAAAVSAATREGFPPRTIIFLDQEQGGRLLPEQRSYLLSWADGVASRGFRAGVYCSGIGAKESSDNFIVTAKDIQQHAGSRKLHYWVANDSCPTSPGCAFPKVLPSPASSGIPFAEVWQFAQSPQRREFTKKCNAKYAEDGNCYPPIGGRVQQLHVDLNVAISSDPSEGRSHK
ncbi:MAG TPA: glycoside hydrolase domain-containing protein [Candidatus Acidoferrales bacterium]|nr:glycoside hydrolase domain-containing protein [Candidatus Acidoferrales bacterium]